MSGRHGIDQRQRSARRAPATSAWGRSSLGMPGLLSLIGKLGRVSLPAQTVARWVSLGLITPSIRGTSGRALGHRWSAADVALVIWLARLRDAGWDVVRFRRGARVLWTSLAQALEHAEQPYLVLLATDAVRVMSEQDIPELLRSRPDTVTVLWPAIPLERIRQEAALMGIANLP